MLGLFFGAKSNFEGYKKIEYNVAVELMKNEHILIDVRTKEEYESGHIKGSINIPLDIIKSVNYDKDKVLIVYCRSGRRSKMAADILLELGYKNVYDLGSITSWQGDIVK